MNRIIALVLYVWFIIDKVYTGKTDYIFVIAIGFVLLSDMAISLSEIKKKLR